MFPWNYGFEWNAGHMIFLGVFYTVVTVVTFTIIYALWKSMGDFRTGRTGKIAWHGEFADLLPAERACRHAFTSEMPGRVCSQEFNCANCTVHQRNFAPKASEPMRGVVDDSLGMEVPLDRYYHRGHTWARREDDGTFTIGLDELARRVVARPEAVELPAVGVKISQNGMAWRMKAHGTEFRVMAPIDGEVVETGSAASGWFLRVKPTPETSVAPLLRGREVICWLTREMERIQLAVSGTTAAPALADGGVPVDDFAEACPTADWSAVGGSMFLQS